MRKDMAHVWRLVQFLPFKTVRAEVACIFCFISHKLLPSPGRVPSRVRCAPAQRVAEDGLTKAHALRRPSHKRVIFSPSLYGRLEEKCAPRGASRKHTNALLFQDRRARQPHPPSELVTRRLPLGECQVQTGLNGSKCSLTCLGQVSVSGAQAGHGSSLLVGIITRTEVES